MHVHNGAEDGIALERNGHVVGAGQQKSKILAALARLEQRLAVIELHAHVTSRLTVLIHDDASHARLSRVRELNESVLVLEPNFGEVPGGRREATADFDCYLIGAIPPVVDVLHTATDRWPPIRLIT